MKKKDKTWTLDPRLAADTWAIGDSSLSRILLMDDVRWPWLILVPRVTVAREWIDLDAAQQKRLTQEIDQASRVLNELFQPFKLNVAALGNVVNQLHVHVVARQTGDPAWPRPVWGVGERVPYSSEEREQRMEALRTAFPLLALPVSNNLPGE